MKSMGFKTLVSFVSSHSSVYLSIGEVGELLDENLVNVVQLFEDDEKTRTDEEAVQSASFISSHRQA